MLIDLLIDLIHCGPSRAHVGASRVLATLTKKYFFRSMKERVCLPAMPTQHVHDTDRPRVASDVQGTFGKVLGVHGCLRNTNSVRHDQEKGLTGAFKELCEELNIQQVLGLPNKPHTNGRVEAQVRNVKYALKSLTLAQGSKGKWPKELWKVQLALNTSVSHLTHETPELMMFGPQGGEELL